MLLRHPFAASLVCRVGRALREERVARDSKAHARFSNSRTRFRKVEQIRAPRASLKVEHALMGLRR
jgi:hypothetical protein